MIDSRLTDLGGQSVEAFHRRYYEAGTAGGTWNETFWLGVPTLKCPLDLWIYQEILHEIRPELILETGTASGGSALFLACMCDLLGQGEVVTVDLISQSGRPEHARITYLTGSSVSRRISEQIEPRVRRASRVLVILDSDHSRDHVLRELELYAPWVTAGSYLIVEDTNVNGHPVAADFGPGPMEAVEEFLTSHPEFVLDPSREKFLMTFNPRGYLRKRD